MSIFVASSGEAKMDTGGVVGIPITGEKRNCAILSTSAVLLGLYGASSTEVG